MQHWGYFRRLYGHLPRRIVVHDAKYNPIIRPKWLKAFHRSLGGYVLLFVELKHGAVLCMEQTRDRGPKAVER